MINVHSYKYLLSGFQLIIKLWARETNDWITQDTTISCKHDRSAHIQLEHHDLKLKIFCITSYTFVDKVKKQLRTSIIPNAKSDDKSIIHCKNKKTGKVHSTQQMSYLPINNKNYSIYKHVAEQWERELFPRGKVTRA